MRDALAEADDADTRRFHDSVFSPQPGLAGKVVC
jgi:hypothetical protein